MQSTIAAGTTQLELRARRGIGGKFAFSALHALPNLKPRSKPMQLGRAIVHDNEDLRVVYCGSARRLQGSIFFARGAGVHLRRLRCGVWDTVSTLGCGERLNGCSLSVCQAVLCPSAAACHSIEKPVTVAWVVMPGNIPRPDCRWMRGQP
jgi:hypothetical protein